MSDVNSKITDVASVKRRLKAIFSEITNGMGVAFRQGNEQQQKLYQWECEMAYFIDEIERGPDYFRPKVINDCNDFLAKIRKEVEQSQTETNGSE